jgi:hypothetical protein
VGVLLSHGCCCFQIKTNEAEFARLHDAAQARKIQVFCARRGFLCLTFNNAKKNQVKKMGNGPEPLDRVSQLAV